MWKNTEKTEHELSIGLVRSRLEKLFSPLVDKPFKFYSHTNDATSLVYLELPVENWCAEYWQKDEQTLALSIDFPFDSKEVLSDSGISVNKKNVLPELCRQFEKDPEPILSELAPHFCLLWASQQGNETYVQNDGLGFCQIFEFNDGDSWVLTNKISALPALGIQPQLHKEDWATRLALGGFLLDSSGFKDIRTLAPATRLRITRNEINRENFDVIGGWLNADRMTEQDCCELAKLSLHKQLVAASKYWKSPPAAGLTGGRDSRAVTSALLAEGIDFSVRIRGQLESYDVMVAMELAKIAGLELSIERETCLPPASSDELKRKILMALLWQAGNMRVSIHKIFLAGSPFLSGGKINIMGQHGEIGRGMYQKFMNLKETGNDKKMDYEDLLYKFFRGERGLLKPCYEDYIRDVFSTAYRQGDRYDLQGQDQLDYFGLMQQTSRFNSGGQYAQPGQVISPFLNADFIRASFQYPANKRENDPFHQYIISTNMPKWKGVRYDNELRHELSLEAKEQNKLIKLVQNYSYMFRQLMMKDSWAQPYAGDDFINWRYWKTVGKPLIKQCLQDKGEWRDIFINEFTLDNAYESPDELVVSYLISQQF